MADGQSSATSSPGIIDDFHARDTVIWVSPCFWYPRTKFLLSLGFPGDTQNNESVKLGQMKISHNSAQTPFISLIRTQNLSENSRNF